MRVAQKLTGHTVRRIIQRGSIPDQKLRVSPLVPGHDRKYFATCFPGLEDCLMSELENISGAKNIEATLSGISFTGNQETGYEANLRLRTAIRVLELIKEDEMDVYSADAAYEFSKTIHWDSFVPKGASIDVSARMADCTIISSPTRIQQRVCDAVCDKVKDAKRNPIKSAVTADVPLVALAHQNKMLLYRDLSGSALHHYRSHKVVQNTLDLNETVAAGLLMKAGWHNSASGESLLVDPMCRSGIFLIEAAMMATNFSPGLLRNTWPFLKWPDFDKNKWKAEVNSAMERINVFEGDIIGANSDEHGYQQIIKNFGQSQVGKLARNMRFVHSPCADLNLTLRGHNMCVTNPPWETNPKAKEGDLTETWRALGWFLKNKFPTGDAWILSGPNKNETTRFLGLKSQEKIPVAIGGVDSWFVHYPVLPLKSRQMKET